MYLERDGGTLVCRQVVGVLARRLDCRAPGASVRTGERFGLMKFGSRMDVYLPPSAQVTVKKGEKVNGGKTILGVFP